MIKAPNLTCQQGRDCASHSRHHPLPAPSTPRKPCPIPAEGSDFSACPSHGTAERKQIPKGAFMAS